MAKCKCQCENRDCVCSNKIFKLKGNLSSKLIRQEKLDGRAMLVVPMIMAKSGVVMNDGLIPDEEFEPATWNGVPLTASHPLDGDEFVTANSPEIIETFSIGRVFNTTFENGSLKAEAWIDVQKANKIDKGIISKIKNEKEFEVSTGFLANEESESGVSNGVEYSVLFRNIRPDHMALLPNEVGACSWKDGCGIRPNKDLNMAKKQTVGDAFRVIANSLGIKVNEDDEDEDVATNEAVVAKLIGAEETPFGDDDKESLDAMSSDTLNSLMDSFGVSADDDEEPEANADDDEDEDKEPEANNEDDEEKDMKKNHIQKGKRVVPSGFSAEDKEALAFVRKSFSDHRDSLIKSIVANSEMEKEALADMPVATLETISKGLTKSPTVLDFSARPIPTDIGADDEDEVAAMGGSGVISNLRKDKEAS